jgi:hypothetical protein
MDATNVLVSRLYKKELMKYVYGLLVMVLFSVTSCNTDDDGEVPCRDSVVPSQRIFIALVDADGTDLVANETYSADDITITYRENTFTNVVVNDIPNGESFIVLSVFGEDGDNIYRIQLSDTEEDILKLNLSITTSEGPCPSSITALNSITYNDELQVSEDFFGDRKITVVKD